MGGATQLSICFWDHNVSDGDALRQHGGQEQFRYYLDYVDIVGRLGLSALARRVPEREITCQGVNGYSTYAIQCG